MNVFHHLNAMMNNNLTFDEKYRCYPMAFSGRSHLEEGDKILLPPSALNKLALMNVEYPMLFELSNSSENKYTHCGVLEFSAEEGRCYIPFWMMQNLFLAEGGLINVKNVSLPKATFVKFRPQQLEFLNITNPRAVLENTLRKFTCVTVGDVLCIRYLDSNYFLEIRDVQPGGAASIVEADFNVDFDEPVGYKESLAKSNPSSATGSKTTSPSASPSPTLNISRALQKATAEDPEAPAKDAPKFKAFGGSAQRIDGKSINKSNESKGDTVNNNQQSQAPKSTPSSNNGQPPLPPRQSLVGDKFAKKKTAVSAFSGPANKLT